MSNVQNVTDLRTEFVENLAQLEACLAGPTADDTILAWDNGLTVATDGKTLTVRMATEAKAFTPNKGEFAYPVVLNGKNEVAKASRRGDVCAKEIEALRRSIQLCDNYLAKQTA